MSLGLSRVPTLCESSTMSLSDVMLKVQREGMPPLTSDIDLPLPSLLQVGEITPCIRFPCRIGIECSLSNWV
ncbi:unnamed protein product [Nippostrongylus brasiliensis]|uniref:Uncharacterized protein n=1 Tax=Nippostrongylus brasiliensis TaxID=27835 RepID=A0A0N4YZ70_NIPBR|nr:unnamed protein product [Nippostrongylus brasiliensis]